MSYDTTELKKPLPDHYILISQPNEVYVVPGRWINKARIQLLKSQPTV